MEKVALLDSGVWAANFLERDDFNAVADKLIVSLVMHCIGKSMPFILSTKN